MAKNQCLVNMFVFLLYLEQLKGHVYHQRNSDHHEHADQEILVDVFKHQRNDFTPAPPKLKPYKDSCTADNAICVLPVQCPAHFKNKEMKFCNVIGGRRGICCISGQNHTRKLFNVTSINFTLVSFQCTPARSCVVITSSIWTRLRWVYWQRVPE